MQPRVPQFVFDGQLTEAGKQVIKHINAQIDTIQESADDLNSIAGHYQYYWVHVVNMKAFDDVEFAESFGNLMRHAWEDMEYINMREAQTQKVDETSEKTTELEESLAQFKEELLGEVSELKKQISSLKGQNTKLKNQLKEQEETEEQDAEDDEPVADETTDETEQEEQDAE